MIRLAAASRLAGAYETAQARLNAAWSAFGPAGPDEVRSSEPDSALAEHHLEQSRLALALEDHAGAQHHASVSRGLSEALNHPAGVTWGRFSEAAALLAGGESNSASELLNLAEEEERELGQPLLRGRIATLQAEVQRRLGEVKLAGEALAEASRRLAPATPAAAEIALVRARLAAPHDPQIARSILTHLVADAERLGWGQIAQAALRCGDALDA